MIVVWSVQVEVSWYNHFARSKAIITFKCPTCNNNHLFHIFLIPYFYFSGTIFAYGQSGSGKTHTISGSEVQQGVIEQGVDELFDIIDQVGCLKYFLWGCVSTTIVSHKIVYIYHINHCFLHICNMKVGMFSNLMGSGVLLNAHNTVYLNIH